MANIKVNAGHGSHIYTRVDDVDSDLPRRPPPPHSRQL